MQSLKLVTAPEGPPVTLAEMKSWLHVDHVYEDNTLRSLTYAATEVAQTHTKRQFVTATYQLRLNAWPAAIELPRPPLQSVTSVVYLDENGVSTTFSSSDYEVDINSEPGRITLAYQESWPSLRYVAYPITIQFVCGYGAATAVPDAIKTAIKMLVHHWFVNRVPVITDPGFRVMDEVPMSVKALLDSHSFGHYAGTWN